MHKIPTKNRTSSSVELVSIIQKPDQLPFVEQQLELVDATGKAKRGNVMVRAQFFAKEFLNASGYTSFVTLNSRSRGDPSLPLAR